MYYYYYYYYYWHQRSYMTACNLFGGTTLKTATNRKLTAINKCVYSECNNKLLHPHFTTIKTVTTSTWTDTTATSVYTPSEATKQQLNPEHSLTYFRKEVRLPSTATSNASQRMAATSSESSQISTLKSSSLTAAPCALRSSSRAEIIRKQNYSSNTNLHRAAATLSLLKRRVFTFYLIKMPVAETRSTFLKF